MSNAAIGHGSAFAISTDGGSTWTTIAELTSITPPAATVDTIDVTHMSSPNATREFIAGLNDPGEASLELNFLPGSNGDALLRSVLGTQVKCKNTWPNGVTWTFDGILTTYAPTAPLDDKMTASATFKVTGSVVASPLAAPTNVVKPAISGVAQVGQVLTAYPGEWTGTPTYTYQWKKGGTNISGATAKTYTPVSGDVAGILTVAVTGTNAVGNATATSAGLAAIIA